MLPPALNTANNQPHPPARPPTHPNQCTRLQELIEKGEAWKRQMESVLRSRAGIKKVGAYLGG